MGKDQVSEIDVVLEAEATIGESPTWSPDESALYWIDVKQPALHRLHPATGQRETWTVGADIGAFALLPDLSGAVVALRNGLCRLDFARRAPHLLAPPPFDPALYRFNEGACDPSGRFWVGVMFDPLQPGRHQPGRGGLHSFTFAGGLRPEPDAAELHNGMAWSQDGRQFFISHSYTREIHRFEVDARGNIGHRRLFARPETGGIPDGAAVDAEGGYWCALHGAGRLRRFHPDGTPDRDVPLPVSQPTMCAFGGDRLDLMYVTSATDGLSPAQRAREPHAGAILAFRPGVEGVPRRCTVAP